MFLTQGIVNKIIASRKDLPIKQIGKNSPERLIEVLFDEQWDEFGRQIDKCDKPTISITHFGKFSIQNSRLRSYVRDLVRYIRRKRKKIAEKELEWGEPCHENYLPKILERQTIEKLKVCWQQLDYIRIYWLARKAKYQEKLTLKAQMSDNIDTNLNNLL